MSWPEFRYPFNIIFIILPAACLVLLILGYMKKERIMNMLRIKTRTRFKVLRTVLAALGLGLILFSMLGPQSFMDLAEVNKEGLDIYVLIDTSKSMLTEDIKPNRISRAKKIIESIIDNLEGDRIGLIPFSSAAYVQMPLTDDYQLARMFMEVIDTDMIGGGGTNVGAAIRLAHSSFERTSSADKVVIVLSDGEEHNKDSLDVLKTISDEHLKIFAIGIGSEKGGLIPVYGSMGEKKAGYKKDSNGEFVMSKLNAETLRSLATSGKGSYYQSTLSGDEINLLIKDISSLKRDTLKTGEIRRFNHLYQYFLGPGILLFLVAYLLPERRSF